MMESNKMNDSRNTERNTDYLTKLTLSAMLLALGLVLPILTGQIQQIGSMLLPMHLPVLLCGLICGWKYGSAIGFLLPLLRFLLFGKPSIFPNVIAMAFELLTYGLVIGLIYSHSKRQCVIAVYQSLLTAMIAGRVVWGAAELILLGIGGEHGFTWKAFFAGAFINAIPGILLQLLAVPAIMVALNKTGLVKFQKNITA